MIQQTGRASISLRVGQFTGKNEIPSPHSFARFEETLLYILFIYLSPFSLSLSLYPSLNFLLPVDMQLTDR